MQFLPDAVEPMPPLPDDMMSRQGGMSLKDMLQQSRRSEPDLDKASKRNSRAVVTDLDWMDYEPAT